MGSASAACEGLDFPLSSSNSQSTEVIGSTIVLKANNRVLIDGKTIKNAFFNQEVEAAAFPERLVKIRKFQIEGNSAITTSFTIKTLTSQYRFADDTLATRTFAISKLDSSGFVDCAQGIESASASKGKTTVKGGVAFKSNLANPIQVFIQEKGPDVTIKVTNIKLEPGETYQFEFISQGERSALSSSSITEQYQLLFGKTAKVDIDDPNAVDESNTDPVDDAGLAEFFAEDSTIDLAGFIPITGTEVGLTTINGAALREFEDPDLDAGKYPFVLTQEKLRGKYPVAILDKSGALTFKRYKKPFLNIANGGKSKKTAKGKVTINDDTTQIKDDVFFIITASGAKSLNKFGDGAKAIVKANIKNPNPKTKDEVKNGYTNVSIVSYVTNNFIGSTTVFEISDPDADIDPQTLSVDGYIAESDTPNGAYSFTIDSSDFGAVILRNGRVVTDITVTESPIDISVITDSIFVQNGIVPVDERGFITVDINDDGVDLLKELETGDEIYIDFDIVSSSIDFEDDFGVVIIRKI